MNISKAFSGIAPMIFGLSLLLINPGVNGQSNSPYTPQIIPPSPNAASLGKFGDIPVSPYTGTTDISVPVYTIQAKGVSVPVSLSYHSGGIRLSEEAGWVGLGWALSAGGMISRTINDKDDFMGGYFNSDFTAITPFPEIRGKFVQRTPYPTEPNLGTWGYAFTCRYKVNTEVNTYNLYNAVSSFSTFTTAYDMEPDSYSFNFLGRSGKFIIAKDKTVVLQKQENLKINFASDASSFTITDEQGNRYIFQDKEYNQPATGGAQHISSWLLSKIITQQKDSVTFNYFSDNTWTTVKGIEHESDRRGVAGTEGTTYSNDPGQSYMNKTLQSIDYANVQVQFSFDGVRSDVQGGKKLNNIKIYSKDQTGTLKYLKEQQFFYSYFNTNLGLDTLEFLRLRLDSVKEVSGTNSLPAYTFAYNMPAPAQSLLLGKHYSSVDHWGFFNGKSNAVAGNNSLGFLPPFNGIASIGGQGNSTLLDLPGANRDPDSSFMKAFSLSKVSYPTGGYTYLDYDPNYYDYYNSIAGPGGKDFEYIAAVTKSVQVIINKGGDTSGTIDLSHIFYTVPVTLNAINLNVSVAFRAIGNDSLMKYHNMGFGKIQFAFQGNITDISDNTLQCQPSPPPGSNCSGTIYATSVPFSIRTATSYTWSAHIDPIVKIPGGLQDIVVTFTWKEALFNNTTMLMSGGLRVKSVTDYNSTGAIAKKRVYDYGYQQDRNGDGIPENYSFGRQMGYLSYGRYEVIDISSSTHGTSFTRYSSSNSSFTSQSSGNIVGYDQVTEYTVDPASGADIGKTVYTYNNSSDTTFTYGGFRFPGVNNLPNNLNGMPRSKSVFSRSGTGYKRISSAAYFYRAANRSIYDCVKYMHLGNLNPDAVVPLTCSSGAPQACNCPVQIDSTGWALITNYYPSISSEVVLLDSTIEKSYDQNDTTIQLTMVTRNSYDNPKHFQVTRSSNTDSKNNTSVSYVKYPQDYIPVNATVTGNTILDTMINKNMVAAAIEKRDSLYYSGSSSGYIKGAQLSTFKILSNQSIAPDKIYKLDITNPVTNFTGYSISGNTTSKDSRYRQMISFDSYDNLNNIQQYTGTDQVPVSYIWDYKNIYPVAQVKNASLTDVAYTSFEADGGGNWSIASSVRDNTNAITGKQSYNLNNGTISKGSLINGKQYVLAYWSINGLKSITGGTQSNKTGRTVNGWTYYEHLVTMNTTSLSVGGVGLIDELRLYPLGALMTTYTYDALVGLTATSDPNSETGYFEYDPFLRLKNIKDYQGNIVKNFQYNYQNSCGTNCYVLTLQTFTGFNTPSYPVGVFNINKQYIGTATSPSTYVSLWNSNTTNQAIGVLSTNSDSLHFNLALTSGATLPSVVYGLRYYQWDVFSPTLVGLTTDSLSFIDWGDGNKELITAARQPLIDTVPYGYMGQWLHRDFMYYVVRVSHTYSINQPRTITLFHNETTEAVGITSDGINNTTQTANIRGYYPSKLRGLVYNYIDNSSDTAVKNVTALTELLDAHYQFYSSATTKHNNWQPINNSHKLRWLKVAYKNGLEIADNLRSNFPALVYFEAQEYKPNISTAWGVSGFPNMYVLIIGLTSGTITTAEVDTMLINQAAANNLSNGVFGFSTPWPVRSTASDAANSSLLSRGWTLSVNSQ